MKFEQFQQVKKEALKAFADDTTLNVPFVDVARTDSLNLALIGDAYYALTLRRCLTAYGYTQCPGIAFPGGRICFRQGAVRRL